MTSKPVAFLLADLGVTQSHSRPHVSDDNPFSEAQFKTLKYRPDFPTRFASIEAARLHCQTFFAWSREKTPLDPRQRRTGVLRLTSRPSTESRNPYESGREPGALHECQWCPAVAGAGSPGSPELPRSTRCG